MKRELKYISFDWDEENESLTIETPSESFQGIVQKAEQKIVLRRADIFPLVRFCLRIMQRYFVTGIKTHKQKVQRLLDLQANQSKI